MVEREKSRGRTTAEREGSPPLEQLLAELASDHGGAENPGSNLGADTYPVPEERRSAELYIRFMVDDLHIAVPLQASLEVGRLPGITPLPNLPSWVCGISHIRGDVVSIVDLKRFFGRSPSGGRSGDNMILLHNHLMKVGFRVDRLMGLVTLDGTKAGVSAKSFTRWDKGDIIPYLEGVVTTDEALLYLLDVEKLLTSEKMNSFQRV